MIKCSPKAFSFRVMWRPGDSCSRHLLTLNSVTYIFFSSSSAGLHLYSVILASSIGLTIMFKKKPTVNDPTTPPSFASAKNVLI